MHLSNSRNMTKELKNHHVGGFLSLKNAHFIEYASEIQHTNLRIEMGKYISWKYAENISLILQIIFTYYCGIPYFADFTNYDPFYFKYKQQITDISDSVGEYFIEASYKYLNEAIKCGFFQEKIVKEYIRESLSALALSIAPYFNEIISALNNNELTWEFAYSETQKWVESNPFEKLWTFKGDYTTLNLYQTSFKGNENIFDRMVKNYKLEEDDPPYRTQFLRRYIASILKTNFSCNTNDFIDELIFELYSLFESDEFVCFVSLDKKFRNFLKTLNDKKFNASISFISLKTNKKM